MSRARERWQRMVDQALERDHHRCRLELPGCVGDATTIVVTAGEQGQAVTADRLRAACSSCSEMLEPTAEQQLALEAEEAAAEPEGSYADQTVALRERSADGVETVIWMSLEKARAWMRGKEAIAYWPGQPRVLSADDDGELQEHFVDPSTPEQGPVDEDAF